MNVAALDRRSDGSCDGVHLYVYGRPLTTAPCSMRGGNYSYFSWSDGRCRCSESTSSHVSRPDDIHADVCALRGPHLQLDRVLDPTGSAFTAAHPMTIAHVVHYRALTSRCRVTDPAMADLFLVPLYTLAKVKQTCRLCACFPTHTNARLESADTAQTKPSVRTVRRRQMAVAMNAARARGSLRLCASGGAP